MSKKNKIKEGLTKDKFLVFKNYLFCNDSRTMPLLFQILDYPLSGKQCRARARFLKSFDERIKEIEQERIRLLENLAEKDENDKLKINEQEYVLSPENLAQFQKEYIDLIQEDFIIDILPSNKEDIDIIKDLILNSPIKFNVQQGIIYEQICKIFE